MAFSLPAHWSEKLNRLVAKWMIKLGKLTHVDYSISELNELVKPFFPQSMQIDVPVGKGLFTISEASVDIPRKSSHIEVQLHSSLDIDAIGNPLYRAHVLVILSLTPAYDKQHNTVSIGELELKSIHLINDQYAVINDSKQLLNMVLPKGVQNLITGTFKSAMGIMTAGSSDAASDYLRMYLSGSKQKVLDYHQPQLIKLIDELKHDPEFVFELDKHDWQQALFRQFGEKVVVEDRCVRFKF
ncbi:hypothetical protein [Aliiglaciecola litoralis]|uniref:hypothetical protein n=1 Tax=Aliiglaciecola litoralis TaxID=582857 RepID=UPI0031DA8FB9